MRARKGDRLCHVYSDRSIEELLEWGEAHGLKPHWIDRKHALPHFDVLGETVAEHEPGVSRDELVADIRWWRHHQNGGDRRR